MKTCCFAALLLAATAFWGHAGEIAALDRLFAVSEIEKSSSIGAQMSALRNAALKQSVVSDPVSDRYIVTEFGGSVDIVHFLSLAIQVGAEGKDSDQALWDQYVAEGGVDFEKGATATYPAEAHPDDLPSNALGALFGSEIAEKAPNNLQAALEDFLRPLSPLPDEATRRFSHNQLVMGLPSRNPKEHVASRHEWFTARPLLVVRLVASPGLVPSRQDADAALARAGLAVDLVRGRPIKLRRIPPPASGAAGANFSPAASPDPAR